MARWSHTVGEVHQGESMNTIWGAERIAPVIGHAVVGTQASWGAAHALAGWFIHAFI